MDSSNLNNRRINMWNNERSKWFKQQYEPMLYQNWMPVLYTNHKNINACNYILFMKACLRHSEDLKNDSPATHEALKTDMTMMDDSVALELFKKYFSTIQQWEYLAVKWNNEYYRFEHPQFYNNLEPFKTNRLQYGYNETGVRISGANKYSIIATEKSKNTIVPISSWFNSKMPCVLPLEISNTKDLKVRAFRKIYNKYALDSLGFWIDEESAEENSYYTNKEKKLDTMNEHLSRIKEENYWETSMLKNLLLDPHEDYKKFKHPIYEEYEAETFEARGENMEHWTHHKCVFCDYKTEPKWLRLRKDKRCPKCAVNREDSENNKFMIPDSNFAMSLFSPQAKRRFHHSLYMKTIFTEEEIEAAWEERKDRFRNKTGYEKLDWEEIDKNKEFRAESSKPHSVTISRSSNSQKKLMAVFEDSEGKKIKTTHFGQRGASDYTKHGDKERMQRYLERHGGGTTTSTKEDWKDPTTAGALSRWILWNKPSLSASFSDYKSRFGLKGTLNVSKSAEERKCKSCEKPATIVVQEGSFCYECLPINLGAEYKAKSPAQESLDDWNDEKWKTKSGKPSGETGERFLPTKAIESLTDKEYKETSDKKRRDSKKGKQFSDQPKSIAEKTAKYRAETFEAIEGTGSKARFTDTPDSKVYRDTSLRQKARNKILKGTKGGNAGQWSAIKANLSATEYRNLYENKYGEGKNPYF